MRLRSVGMLLLVAAAAIVALLPGSAYAANNSAPTDRNWGFVTHSGSHLELDGKPFRFSGANIEWLGLIGYGPHNWGPGQTEVYPSDYEINDALATAHEMGATVVRAQTLGDTVGCGNCLEPTLGQFNPRAFRVMDYAVMRARHYGIRLIFEFEGDSRAVNSGATTSIFSDWVGGGNFQTDPTVIKDFENHIAHIVDHVNTYTGIPYKDDPSILGWMDCNACGGSDAASNNSLVATISSYVKSLDPHHLFIDNSTASDMSIPSVDVYATEIYPHWSQYYGLDAQQILELPHQQAAEAAAAGKAWMMSEFGWDDTDIATPAGLQTWLAGIEQDHNISGDLFWALESHANGHGWQPIPANDECQADDSDTAPPTQPDPTGKGCYTNEDGNWWALYYTGIPTLSNTQSDMAQRAQILRTHAYRMRGFTTLPPHDIPPAPAITSITDGRVYWQGSAGAAVYSIEHASTPGGPWTTVCDRCVTDLSNGWPQTTRSGWYRVIPYNLGGVPGPASAPYSADRARGGAVAVNGV